MASTAQRAGARGGTLLTRGHGLTSKGSAGHHASPPPAVRACAHGASRAVPPSGHPSHASHAPPAGKMKCCSGVGR